MKPVPPPPPVILPTAKDGALQMLGILQRDARLIDFLMEDITSYADDQVGAAVRSLHADCRTNSEPPCYARAGNRFGGRNLSENRFIKSTRS